MQQQASAQASIKGTVLGKPELKVTSNGRPFTKFDIGVEGMHPQLGIPQTVNIHVATWTDVAEWTEEYVKQGDFLEFTGRFETRPYTGTNGQTYYWTEFIANVIKKGNVQLTNLGFMKLETEETEQTSDFTPPWEGAPDGRIAETQTSDTPEPQISTTSQE